MLPKPNVAASAALLPLPSLPFAAEMDFFFFEKNPPTLLPRPIVFASAALLRQSRAPPAFPLATQAWKRIRQHRVGSSPGRSYRCPRRRRLYLRSRWRRAKEPAARRRTTQPAPVELRLLQGLCRLLYLIFSKLRSWLPSSFKPPMRMPPHPPSLAGWGSSSSLAATRRNSRSASRWQYPMPRDSVKSRYVSNI